MVFNAVRVVVLYEYYNVFHEYYSGVYANKKRVYNVHNKYGNTYAVRSK